MDSDIPGIPPEEAFHLDGDISASGDNWDGGNNDENTGDMDASNQSSTEKPDDELSQNDVDSDIARDIALPRALEEVLALKDQRVQELWTEEERLATSGISPSDFADAEGDSDDEGDTRDEFVAVADDDLTKKKDRKMDRNRKKKLRKKQQKQSKLAQKQPTPAVAVTTNETESVEPAAKETEEKIHKKDKKDDDSKGDEDVQVEYVPEKITVADLAPMYRQFYRVFEIFKIEEPKVIEPKSAELLAAEKAAQAIVAKGMEKGTFYDDDDDDDDANADKDGGGDEKDKMSKRKMKKMTRLSVAELKQLVNRPDVVEMHDVTARDPKLLVQLKAHRNTVQVPRHWCFKRKYLQGKRGIEKPPFDLPAFIKKTGIMEMRASLQEKDESKTLKAKMRERARPKMGKIDIDYQKLHDAFFKWQTKPRMTIHGDLYYEGKEFETRLKEKKPGDLSEELRIALGMPIGPNCHKIPPPWLIAQQRYGPPPSYPSLKIPGLNAPIPDGTSFGYHAGGWGKPPVDENGKPLYGDVFGMSHQDLDSGIDDAEIDRQMWGELESESEESSEEEEEEGEDLTQQPDESGLVTPAEGLVTPSGLTSGVPPGLETPDTIELRKKKIESEMEDNETPVLYQILPEKRGDRIGASMMGSTHVYDLGTAAATSAKTGQSVATREGMVELALDPSELDMDNDAMAQRYEQQMREQQSHLKKEDLTDMLAEHMARQKSKRKRQVDTTSKQAKKYKEFKF